MTLDVETARRVQSPREVEVTVVRRPDCSHGVLAIAAITRLAAELGIAVAVEEVLVQTDEEARERRCLGSPTVLVAGRDVDPEARSRESFGVT